MVWPCQSDITLQQIDWNHGTVPSPLEPENTVEKSVLKKMGVLIYDPQRRTCLCPDWSKTGIGYWLRQKILWLWLIKARLLPNRLENHLNRFKILKGCRETIRSYWRVALAISYALEDTKYFTLGCDDLIVATDHEPLAKVFGDRALYKITNPRISQLKQRTLSWRFKVVYIPAKCIPASDATSRNQDIIASIKSSLNHIDVITWDLVKSYTDSDESSNSWKNTSSPRSQMTSLQYHPNLSHI